MKVPDSRLFNPADQRKQVLAGLADKIARLPLAEPGECQDCHHDGPRRLYFARVLCSGCALSRLKGAEQAYEPAEFVTLCDRLLADPA